MDSGVAFLLALLAVAVAFFGYCWWWCHREWFRIWRAPQTAYEQIVYRQGARGWGLMMWLAMAIAFPLYDSVRAHHALKGILLYVGFRAILEFPMSLWFGYWWGRAMAAVFGVKDSVRAV